jgi:hypothetical protein
MQIAAIRSSALLFHELDATMMNLIWNLGRGADHRAGRRIRTANVLVVVGWQLVTGLPREDTVLGPNLRAPSAGASKKRIIP